MTDPSLIDQYRMLHQRGHYKGTTTVHFADAIGELCARHEAKTLLDYGCGKGLQYAEHKVQKKWKVEVTCYDPAVYQFQKLADGPFDGVICVDVLEHVTEDEVEKTLREIFSRATKFVFLTVCPREAKKTLPDGRNAHRTVKPEEWWKVQIAMVGADFPQVAWEMRVND